MPKVNKSKLIITGENKSALAAIDGVARKMGSAERQIKGFGKGISGTIGSIGGVLSNLPVAMGAAVSGMVAGFGIMVKNSIDTAEHLEKMSQRVGVSVEALSTLSYAAQLSGTDIAVFEKAIQRLSRNMDDASRGIGEGKIAFEQLGIDVIGANGKLKDAETILKEVADKFGLMEDGTKKTALALKIFGRAGADLIPMLNGGSEALNKMQQEARELGLEVSTNTAKSAAEFKDDTLRLESALSGLVNTITVEMLPILNDFTDWLLENKGAVAEFVRGTIKELRVLIYLLNNPTLENINAFLMEGFDMKIPKESIRATNKELGELNDNVRLVVDSTGKIKKIKIIDDNSKAMMNDFTIAEKRARFEAERLERQWTAIKTQLENEIAKNNLSQIAFQFYQIDKRVESLYSKFGQRDLIGDWALSMRNALSNFESFDYELPDFNVMEIPVTLKPLNIDTSFYDMQKEQIASVTAFELANLALRQQGTVNMFSDMANAAQLFYESSEEKNKTAFELYKAFAIAQTAIATYQAAVEAYKSLVGIPVVGPGLAVAAAAAATAFGLAQIRQIESMRPGARGSGVSSPPVPHGQASNNTVNNYNQNRNVVIENIIIQTSYQDKDEIAREIVPAIRRAIADGV